MVLGLKMGIDLFVGQKTANSSKLINDIEGTCLEEFDAQTKVYIKSGHLKMVNDIRIKFIDFIKNLNPNELTGIKKMAFERRLKFNEKELLIRDLKEKFDFDTWSDNSDTYYWEPLSKTNNQKPVIHFADEIFNETEISEIIEMVTSISGKRIYLFHEEKLHYEIETNNINFNWIEAAYCDKDLNWLIYISHEGTISFCGETLLKGLTLKLERIMEYANPWN